MIGSTSNLFESIQEVQDHATKGAFGPTTTNGHILPLGDPPRARCGRGRVASTFQIYWKWRDSLIPKPPKKKDTPYQRLKARLRQFRLFGDRKTIEPEIRGRLPNI